MTASSGVAGAQAVLEPHGAREVSLAESSLPPELLGATGTRRSVALLWAHGQGAGACLEHWGGVPGGSGVQPDKKCREGELLADVPWQRCLCSCLTRL